MSAEEPTNSKHQGWAAVHRLRSEVRQRYPSVWALGVVGRAEDRVLDGLEGVVRVLDIGAGNRGLAERLTGQCPGLVYKSLDTDESYEHDYRDLSQVEEEFDCVVMFEILEHLPHAEGIDMLRAACAVVRAGGKLLASTPNVYHPFQYFRDASHVTPYSYEELGAAILAAGLELETMYRVHPATAAAKVAKRWLAGWLFRFLGIDYAPGLLAVARKAES